MGRRSINTTKSGKYMNPTDQARKEARKQELKKNKKQRQMVRAAVLKGKDPYQILEELEKIDLMEYNVNQPSPLNEKVLRDKRKKLKDTFDRVMGMYYKDDHEKWTELRKRQTEYDGKRAQMVQFFESVKSAQSVTVDEIPLPQLPQQQTIANTIPLPTSERKPEVPIYSIATALKMQALGIPVREPPGCPPGPPPFITDDGEVEEFSFKHIEQNSGGGERIINTESTQDDADDNANNKPSSLQQKMVALSGQNVDDFIKEMETVQKKIEQNKEHIHKMNNNMDTLMPPGTSENITKISSMPPPTNPPPSIMPPPLIFSGSGIRLPPGPPPGRPLLPPGPPPGLPPIRLPPTGPRLIRIPVPPLMSTPQPVPQPKPNVLSAAPQLINRNDSTKHGVTISAKPQIRNLSADVTRFVPSTLRVKREEKKTKPSVTSLVRELKQKEMHLNAQMHQTGHFTKDDAYKRFMEEMEGLM